MVEQKKVDAFDEFVEQVSKESHRAAVILGAAKLDEQLYILLHKCLLPNYSKDYDLLEGDAPLSTFSARIYMCYGLGLIDSDFAKALHQVRKIRNEFAHQINVRLDRPPQKDKVRSFVSLVKNSDLFEDVKNVYFEETNDLSVEFFISLTLLAVLLEKIIADCSQLNGNKAGSLSQNQKPRK